MIRSSHTRPLDKYLRPLNAKLFVNIKEMRQLFVELINLKFSLFYFMA